MFGHKKFLVLLLVAGFISVPAWPILYFSYIDNCSIPLWVAPSDIRKAIDKNLPLEEGEYVRFVNFDAFDYEHINVLTSHRLLSIPHFREPIEYEIDLQSIKGAWIDPSDRRFLVIETTRGTKDRMFFVGSPSAFARALH